MPIWLNVFELKKGKYTCYLVASLVNTINKLKQTDTKRIIWGIHPNSKNLRGVVMVLVHDFYPPNLN